jgi:hypothetical protein
MGEGGTAELVVEDVLPGEVHCRDIARAQLLTENTLYPVALVLDERRRLPATAW